MLPADAPRPPPTQEVYRGLLLFAGTVLAVWAFGLILLPFVVPVAWALCLAAVTQRPHAWLRARWGRPRLAAGAMTLATGLVIVAPMVVASLLLLAEARTLDYRGAVEAIEARAPQLDDWLRELGIDLGVLVTNIRDNAPGWVERLVQGPLGRGTLSIVLAPLVFLVFLVLTLVTQYFVYCEGPRLWSMAVEISPLEPRETEKILDRLRRMTSAAIVGGLLIAVLQGALGGLAFVIAGLQSPLLWSFVMACFSLLPFGGTALVWVPAAGYLFVVGETGDGIFLLAFGTLVIGTADNILRPWVLRRTGAEDIHPLLLFFAFLSGIALFGVSGIVFGPLLIALLLTVLEIYRGHTREAAHLGEGA